MISAMSTPTGIENIEQARGYAAGARCEGCGKEGALSAYEVRKAGSNQGRLFVKCRHCGSFGWLTAPATPDAGLDRVRATATPCPKCGKERRAGRVAKDGPNKGRLFLTCADPACDGFEWVTPPTGDTPAGAGRPAPGSPRDEDGFHAAIRDNPFDDVTRLVFADWLDEHGQPARAELIRVQVEHDRLAVSDPARAELDRRAREILAEHEAAWVAPLRPFTLDWAFVRGLLDEVQLGVERFVESADEVLRAAPVAGLRILFDGWEDVRALTGCRRLRQIRRLTLLGGRILAESPHVAGLKALALPDQSLGQPGVQALASSRYLGALEVLDLSGNNLARSAVPILVSSANLSRLRRLVLAHNLLQDSDARALANSPHLQELQELDLSGNGITREGVKAILRSPLGKRLRRFDR